MQKLKWAAKSLQRPLKKAKQNRKQTRSLFHLSSSLKNPFQNNKKKEKISKKKKKKKLTNVQFIKENVKHQMCLVFQETNYNAQNR